MIFPKMLWSKCWTPPAVRTTRKKLTEYISNPKDVMGVEMIRFRMFGNKVYIDLEISIDGDKSLREAHEVAERVYKDVGHTFSDIKHIMIHVNSANSAYVP